MLGGAIVALAALDAEASGVAGDKLRVMSERLCLAEHPLSSDVICLRPKHAPATEHSFGPDAGCAIWNDGDTAWRYRPHRDQAQYDCLRGVEE